MGVYISYNNKSVYLYYTDFHKKSVSNTLPERNRLDMDGMIQNSLNLGMSFIISFGLLYFV